MEPAHYRELRKILMSSLDERGELSDEEIRSIIDDLVLGFSHENYLTVSERNTLSRELFSSVRKLDILQELIDDKDVTEIMVNGPERIYVEKNGQMRLWERTFSSREKLEDVVQQIVGNCNRVVNERKPIVDARLSNGARVNAVISPIALDGPILTIRRFPDTPITMEKLIAIGSISEEASHFLQKLVEAGYSIIISGGTSAGKTTFLNALSNYIPKNERIITIEDNAELQIQGIDNLVRLEAKSANMEGNENITIRDLIKSSLRMRPDRVIVGEVRGGEAVDMLQAFNTGHDGSLCTIHANSAADSLSRLETMVLMAFALPLPAIRRQIASGVDILVHLGRLRDRSRRVLEIAEIDGYENENILLHPLYEWDGGRKSLVKMGELKHTGKLERTGVVI
ncbi:MAG: CpaF family protein [Lachnospiraceae bacterium]|jgi:pilus assembly protein CpaF|nr:CpaF family protein [Lachnospiraceae bacterium]MCI1726980.1 CpaF family protein [Lachnospiraceae bacterium]